MAVVGAPDYFKRCGVPRTPQDLTVHDCINMRLLTQGGLYAWEFEKDGITLRVPPQGPLLSSSQDLEVGSAIGGVGIIYTFEEYLRPLFDQGVLLPVLEDWWQAFDGPYLYYNDRRYVPSPLRAFIDFLKIEAWAG